MNDERSDSKYVSSIHAGKLSILEHFWKYSDDNIFIMVLDEDDDFTIEDLNPAQTRNFGMGDEFIGRKLHDLLDDEIYGSVETRYRKCLEQNVPHTYDETFLLHGETRHWNTMIIPVFDSDDGKVRIFGIAREMTQLVNAKETLATINEGLEKAISERTLELQQSNEKLKKQSQKLEEQAYIDPLTGIGNRRYFFKCAKSLLNPLKSRQSPISLIYADLDDFKKLNDTYGHVTGDEVLVGFIDRINQQIRSTDILARFGGEEFVMFIPDTAVEVAIRQAQEILRVVNLEPFIIDNQPINITLSIGIATGIADDGFNLDKLISNADKALYAAKRNGKNRVEVYQR